MKQIFLIFTLYLIVGYSLSAQMLTKIYVLRHADRTAVGDDLSALGLARANDLKRYLNPTKINALFSTNTVRTKKTVQPMATPAMPIQIYGTPTQLSTTIRTTWAGKRVVVVGHSDTVPQIIQACGCTSPFLAAGIPPNQYDNLLLLLVRWNAAGMPTCELLAMKYGAPPTP